MTGAGALVAVGAVDDPMTALHQPEELARVARDELVLDARASQREHEIIDVAEVRMSEMSLDRIRDDLDDGLAAEVKRELADTEPLGPTVAGQHESNALEQLRIGRVRPPSSEDGPHEILERRVQKDDRRAQ